MSGKNKDPWVRIIDVSDPILHSKGYTLYKVTSKVFPKNSVEAVTEVTVWKRYNDFKKLHKALCTLHQNLYLKGTFPPFAKTRFFGRFDPAVIEERRQSALKLLQFAANFSPLFTSQVFVKFFEESHALDINQQPVCKQEPSLDQVLKPQTCLHPISIVDGKDSSIEYSSITKEENTNEAETCLGGIWQHHQVPDNISLGSRGTDDDDRTTFTDDDSVLSRPSLDISEFDPLAKPTTDITELKESISNHVSICNSWLLSALGSSNDSTVDKELENIPEYPTPFDEFNFSENDTALSSEIVRWPKDTTADSSKSHFTFDLPLPSADESNLLSEFNPILNKNFDSCQTNVEDNVCDEFAMTPDAYQNKSAERPSYIILASKYVESAQTAEQNKCYMEAFEMYKKAIEVLLQGIQRDKCSDLKDTVRKKVLLYLMKAEELYENKLPKTNMEKPQVDCSVSSSNSVKNVLDSVEKLNKYKVIGVMDKTLLVLDVTTNITFVAKVLYKRSSDDAQFKASLTPKNVPFMVKLCHVYETNYAIFLILEHATGGRLWNYVTSFFQRRPLSPTEDGTCLHVESKSKTELSNIYSGKKISETSDVCSSPFNSDSDLIPSQHCPSSYIALFKKYADSVNKENYVSLAKYHKNPQNHFECAINSTKHEMIESDKSKDCTLPHKNIRNHLSSSAGSLDTGFSQKTCVLEAFNAMDEVLLQASSKSLLPEACVVLWAAEIVLAFEHLHNLGLIWMDFQPNNILLGDEGHILLTYRSEWSNVDSVISEYAKENLFCAPEVGNIFPITCDCDWWSLGAILFELVTGQSLVSCHPTGITRHTLLNFPTEISLDSKDFITKLLQHNPGERLGSGIYGVEEIKSHRFFHSIDWQSMNQQ